MSNIILPQKIWVGRYNAQIATKGRAVSKDRRVTQFEIELPMEDGGTSYINGKTHPIRTNTVICSKPGQKRHTRLPFKCYYIHMVIKEGYLYDILSEMPDFVELENPERVKNIFERICACHVSKNPENELLRQSLVLDLIYSVYRPTLAVQVKKNKVIEKSVAYIKSNLTSDLSLENLAAEAKFAPSYFHKLFKASTGKPLHKYIEDLRIEQAKNMLITTEMTLTQIAYECGFSSQSYFSYAFKRYTSMTPRAYAKKVMERYDKEKTPAAL